MVARLSSLVLAVAVLILGGCAAPDIKLLPDATEPLEEFVLEGTAPGKVVVVPIRGIISDEPDEGVLVDKPSMVQEVVSHLKKAEKDIEVRAVLLKIDSPGGSVTASDVLYREISEFKTRTGATVVAALMDIAASGGYYISLPADFIMAHPTTLTGSVGVMFLRPTVTGLMEKLGLSVEVNKSGPNKDMGSPFRQATKEEVEIIQGLTESLGDRFTGLVAKHRKLDKQSLEKISTARIYLGGEAADLGLVDEVGYLSDALSRAKRLAGLSEAAKVVVYRRAEYGDDNLYNTATMRYPGGGRPLIDLGWPGAINTFGPGFYYLWWPVGAAH